MATGRAASKARAEKRKSVPVSSKSSGLSASQAANEKSAQNIRFGIKSGETVNYVETERQKDGSYKSNGRSTREKAIRADQIGDMTSPVIPEPPRPDNVGDLLGMNNASVLQEGLTLQGGQFVPDPTASDQMNATREANMNMGNVANSILGYLKPEENQMADLFQDTYGISDREAGRDLRDAERAKNQYTAQLNTLTANRDAEMLKLEGQGRGQTSGFIGGEQARINREAAIQALPIQAQLAAAQADYETAKSHVDTLFGLKVKDLEAQQAYKTTVANTFMSVATAQQQNLLNAAIADSNAKAEAKKMNIQMANQWAQAAFDNNQSVLAGKITRLDTNSPTFAQDLAAIQGQIVNTNAKLAQEAQRANIAQGWASLDMRQQELDLSRQRLEAELVGSGNTTGTIDGKPQTAAQALVNSYANRLIEAETVFSAVADQFADPLAFGGILPSLMQSGERQQYEQAKRNFVNSVLRRESGAVISDQEFKNAELQYFPQAGDKPETILQKERNRNTVINNFYREANVPRPVRPGDIVEAGGVKYQVAEDGLTLIEL